MMSVPVPEADFLLHPKSRRRWWVLLALVLLLVIGGFAAHRMIHDRIGQAITSAAQNRGFEVSWGSLSVSLSGRVTIENLRFQSVRGGSFHGQVDRATTVIGWREINQRVRPERFEVSGVVVRADRDGIARMRPDTSRENEPPGGGATSSPNALGVVAQDISVWLDLGRHRTVLCHLDRAELNRHADPAQRSSMTFEAAVSCQAHFIGLETGDFFALLSKTDDGWNFVAQPPAGSLARVAGARFGRVEVSSEPNRVSVDVADLEFRPNLAETDASMLERLDFLEGLDASLSELHVDLLRNDDPDLGWEVDYLAAGPGRVTAVLRDVPRERDILPDEVADDTDGADHERLTMDEAEAQLAATQLHAIDWESVDRQLQVMTAGIDTVLSASTQIARRLELTDLAITVERGDASIPLTLSSVRASSGLAEAEIQFADHPVQLTVWRDADESLSLALVTERVDLATVSETLGHPGLLGGHLNVDLTLNSGDQFTLDLGVRSDELTIYHPSISPMSLDFLPLRTQTHFVFAPEAEQQLIFTTEGTLGDHIAGRLDVRAFEEDNTTRVLAEFELPTFQCQALLNAVPDGLFVSMNRAGILVEGEAGLDGQLRYTFGNHHSFRLRLGEAFPGTCQIVGMPEGFQPELLMADDFVHAVSPEHLTDEAEPVFVGRGTEGWVPLDELPPWLGPAMYFSEQRLFYEEGPVSLRLINRAIRVNMIYGRWAYGGSTIAQQLAKNVFFDRGKTLARKLEEALVAWAMDSVLTRDQILELYVNCIEFGPDIWGIEQGALYYFGISARDLSPIQTVYLAGLKPSPRSGEGHRRRGQSPRRERWRNRLRDRLIELADHALIDPDYIEAQSPYIIPLGPDAYPEETGRQIVVFD